MFGRLFGRKRSDSPRPAGPADGRTSLGAAVEDYGRRGYRGPFLTGLWDGLAAAVVHGPGVPHTPRWVEAAENPFRMRVLDLTAFAADSPVTPLGDAAGVVERLREAALNPASLARGQTIPDAVTLPCRLTYPLNGAEPVDGPLFVAHGPDDPWSVVARNGLINFVRSWSGRLRYRAHVRCREGSMTVTAVEASRHPPDRTPYPPTADRGLAVRQVDFLLKALVYGYAAPAPLPDDLPGEPGFLAYWALPEYGRWGTHLTAEDSTEFRIGLNGVADRWPPIAGQDALLAAVRAVEANDTPATRRALHDALRAGRLVLSFIVPADVREAIRAGRAALGPDTPVEFPAHTWRGENCYFVFTDPAYRVTRGGGCFDVPGPVACARLANCRTEFPVVINPGGPDSCHLSAAEVTMLAAEADAINSE